MSKRHSQEYLDLARELATQGSTLEPGSPLERQAIERFQGLLSDFKALDFRSRIAEVYAADAFFNDTLKTVHGAAAIESYLAHSAQAVDGATVDFLSVVSNSGDYYFRWAMKIRFKQFARGEDKHSVGMSHIRFDSEGKVVLHQDFWDSTGGFFEHLPALGWMLRRVKKAL